MLWAENPDAGERETARVLAEVPDHFGGINVVVTTPAWRAPLNQFQRSSARDAKRPRPGKKIDFTREKSGGRGWD